eukprot:COSAG02_NODE_2330_length_9119_cov_11.886918_7_plen_135_part_00
MYAPGGQKVEPMAARSSHAQWRTFLSTLIEQEGVDTLTVKKAWTALNSQFGADVKKGDRRWMKDTLTELTVAIQHKKAMKGRHVMVSDDDSDDDELVLEAPAPPETAAQKLLALVQAESARKDTAKQVRLPTPY